jgi:predicted transcriptional regulator
MKKSHNNNKKQAAPLRKLYNPKAHAPSAYMPAWLIQIPDSKLSLGGKMVYGRLAQWSNNQGVVYRSSNQLCHELGMSKSPVDRYLKELRNVGLIGTYQAEKGGVNHFEFYDHEWMHEPIHPNLCYAETIPEQVIDPMSKQTIPHTDIDNTPLSKQTNHKYNKIRINKKEKKASPTEIPDIGNEPIKQKTSSEHLDIEKLFADNPHSLEKEVIQDWLAVRKNKRVQVTPTSWKRINKNLSIIQKETGISPKEAFEIMVASGWQSLELKYFQKDKGRVGNSSEGSGLKDINGYNLTWD